MADHNELKKLQVEQQAIRVQLGAYESEKNQLNARLKELNKLRDAGLQRTRDINQQIESLRQDATATDSLVVSEHAMLRYIERVLGLNLEELKKDIVPAQTVQQMKALGARRGKFPVKSPAGDAHTICVRENVVVSVLTKEEDNE